MKILKTITAALVSAGLTAGVAADASRDGFFWLGEINKASLVINAEEGLLARESAARIARGLRTVLEKGSQPGGERPSLVIRFEPLLIRESGMEATLLHVGRSSQDMLATCGSAMMRDEVLTLAEKLTETMETLNGLARENQDFIVPNYTNGVAAQPNSYAHYLMGFQAAFSRDAQRIREFYERLNLCAMGTTVLNGTSWPLNRDRMAAYLGFAGPVPDAYDAAQIKTVDEPVEIAAILSSIALHVGTFIQEVSVQYAQPRPWILLEEGGENTYVSSAMPQKRNPGLMINVRAAASAVVGEAQGLLFRAHNIIPGMSDPRRTTPNLGMVKDTAAMLGQYNKVLRALRFNRERALEELNLDWTASQEVADVLMREHKLPFRVGHHVASAIVSFGRAHSIRPLDFPYGELRRIYAEVIRAEYPEGDPECPMSEEEFRKTLDPVAIVQNRRTAGGPQKPELQKAIARYDGVTAAQKAWAREKRDAIEAALSGLDADFEKIR